MVKFSVFFVIVSLFCLVSHVRATTLLAYDTDGLVRDSALVVQGVVGEITTHRTSTGRVYRLAMFNVGDTIVGQSPAKIKVRLLGGTWDGETHYVPGEVKLIRGESVILFLEPGREAGVFLVTGMSQGRFEVTTDPRTGETFVHRTLGELHLVSPSKKSGSIWDLDRACTSTFISYAEFVRQIRRLAGPGNPAADQPD